MLGEFGGGINFKLTDKINFTLQSGILLTQQAAFVPIRAGVRF